MKVFKDCLIIVTNVVFISVSGFTQIKVLPDQSVGIGTDDTQNSKHRTYNTSHLTSSTFENIFDGGGNILTGIKNVLNTPGKGVKYGIFNEVNQVEGGSQMYGLYNKILYSGMGQWNKYAASLYNDITISSSASGNFYGMNTLIRGDGNQLRIGVRTILEESGSGNRYGHSILTYGTSEPNKTVGIYNYTYLKGQTIDWNLGNGSGIYNYVVADPSTERPKVGIYNLLDADGSDGYRYGLYNYVFARGSGDRFGIFSRVRNTGLIEGALYGIYSKVDSGEGNYAGYFLGNVVVNGEFTITSDKNKKKDITDLVEGVTKLKKFKAKKYKHKDDKKEKDHFGFIAQDIQPHFPDMVSAGIQPGDPIFQTIVDDEGNETQDIIGYEPDETVLGLNYIEIIPILTLAIQEQQGIIEDLLKRIEKLEK